MGERLPLVVEGRYEYLTVSWTRARSVGVLDTIQGILDEESRNAEILRSGTRMMYAWSEPAGVEFASTPWFQVAGEVDAEVKYAVAVSEEHDGTSVFVCSPIDAATHWFRTAIADRVLTRHGARLVPMQLWSSARSLLGAIRRQHAVDVLALRVRDPGGQIRSLGPITREAAIQALDSLEEDSSVVGGYLHFAGLTTFVQPRLTPGDEPILLIEPSVDTATLEQAIWQIEDFFSEEQLT